MNTTGKAIKQNYDPSVDGNDPTVLAPNPGTKGTYTTDLGMLVPVDDSEELSNAMMQIIDGDVKFDNQAIAEYTERTYSQEAINGVLLSLFSKAIEECPQKSDGKKLKLTRNPQ